ncbi:MAG: hypothetical protein CSA96_01180 [Bacteroidetes bacterium]|nr:MAG: hypothetical protein CSA96_01180 [Bacteroidota bacterium]
MESGELGVDELSLKVERVSGLLTYCREKLHLAEKKVEEVLREKKED